MHLKENKYAGQIHGSAREKGIEDILLMKCHQIIIVYTLEIP